jgi:hypothetical protein
VAQVRNIARGTDPVAVRGQVCLPLAEIAGPASCSSIEVIQVGTNHSKSQQTMNRTRLAQYGSAAVHKAHTVSASTGEAVPGKVHLPLAEMAGPASCSSIGGGTGQQHCMIHTLWLCLARCTCRWLKWLDLHGSQNSDGRGQHTHLAWARFATAALLKPWC